MRLSRYWPRSARSKCRISCLSLRTGSNRSPTFLTRFGTVSILNSAESITFFNSLHFSGVDTGAFGLARRQDIIPAGGPMRLTKRLHIMMNAVVLLTLVAASLEGSSLTFTQIDVPGAFFTLAFGINNAGQIVGSFDNSTGRHGFLDTGGIFTQLD